jgi:hypothetical protein
LPIRSAATTRPLGCPGACRGLISCPDPWAAATQPAG